METHMDLKRILPLLVIPVLLVIVEIDGGDW
jgi:hypothetical protein